MTRYIILRAFPPSVLLSPSTSMALNNVDYAVCISILAITLAWVRPKSSKSKLPLPPGPPRWPLIGSLLSLPRNEPNWKAFMRWGQEKGKTLHESVSHKPLINGHSFRERCGLHPNPWGQPHHSQLSQGNHRAPRTSISTIQWTSTTRHGWRYVKHLHTILVISFFDIISCSVGCDVICTELRSFDSCDLKRRIWHMTAYMRMK